MVDIAIQVQGIDLDDPQALEALAIALPNCLWSAVGDLVTMTVSAEGQDPVAEVAAALKSLDTIPGASALRVHEEIVTIPQIAQRVGVSREAVRKWADGNREFGFPTATQLLSADARGNTRAWLWSDVTVWLLEARGIDLEESLPDLATVAAVNMLIAAGRSQPPSSSPSGPLSRLMNLPSRPLGRGSVKPASRST